MKSYLSICRSRACGFALLIGLGLGTVVQASSVFDLNREDNPYRAGFNRPVQLTVKILTESSFLDVDIQYKTPNTNVRDLTIVDRELLVNPAYMISENRYWESVIGFIDQKAKEAEKAAMTPAMLSAQATSSIINTKPTSGSAPFISQTGLTHSFCAFQDYCVNDQIMSIQISNIPFSKIPDFDPHFSSKMSALRLNMFANSTEFAVYLSHAFRDQLLKNSRLEEKKILNGIYL